MRLFFGFSLDATARSFLQTQAEAARYTLSKGRFTDPDNYHVTLHFLGEVPEARLSSLRSIADSICDCPCMTLTLQGIGRFSKPDGDVVWAGLTTPQSLLILHHRLADGLNASGFQAEKRFSSHITLARNARGTLPQLETQHETVVDRLMLFHSTRVQDRLQYIPIYEVPFKG